MQGFRSILFKNIASLKPGLDITLTSPRFMQGVKGPGSLIYLKRGFRQYGQPSKQTLFAMDIVNDKS